ncbi:uncharacterized protein [Palaemon carinicauda]|uniref:uncharacterized protein n=1 Tax=Palaemon carinicauda TaxID=392227 RepID=UPI0035B597C8
MVEDFERLKNQVANAVALHLPDSSKQFILITDTSDVGAGAMLANKSASKELLPIAFYHHTFSRSEQRYSTTEKEFLAVILAIKRFRMYLSSAPFDLITDHQALRWLNTLDIREERGRRRRWIETIQQFDINPIHKSGRSAVMSMADICQELMLMEIWYRILQDVSEENELAKYGNRLGITTNGILCYINCKGKCLQEHPYGVKEEWLPVIPKDMRLYALQMIHDSPMSGHMGRDRTWERARKRFWWPHMKADVHAHVNKFERRHCGGGKLAPYLSKKYRVIEILRGGWTYKLTPAETITDEVKIRHFDELEKAPVSKYSWETSLADLSDEEVIRIESGTGSNSEGIHRSTWERHPLSLLQVDPSKRSYESEEEEFWDDCSNSENELEDDQNCL